jgi:hypothetical protein
VALNVEGLLAAMESHALTLGYFERVNGHEPNNPPGNGLTAAVWANDMRPVLSSGLASTSARVTFMVRVYVPAIGQPQDDLDPNVVKAVDALMAAYTGDFELGGLIRSVDLLGSTGEPLSAQAGWLPFPDALYRVVTITVPLIVNDLWTQAA